MEPGVISEALLHQCVQEQGPEGEAGRIARSEGIDFREVNTLRLDFKSKLTVLAPIFVSTLCIFLQTFFV